jgi:hypothetical protein
MGTVQRLRWILLAGLGVSGVASATGYEVNGVHLGMTQAEVQAVFGDKIQCTARSPSDSDPSQVTCASTAFVQKKTLSDTFAGQKTVIRYHVLDGHVARISFLGLPSMAFDHIVTTMEKTYGKADVAKKDVRVGIKSSEMVNKRAKWHNDAGDEIVFDKYTAGNLDRGFLNFYAASYPQSLRPAPVE